MSCEPVLTADPMLASSLQAWKDVGGGAALEQALHDPARTITTLAEAGLRGMGGAGFPTWRKWQAAVDAGGRGWVVCNGNEDEPGTFKDRWLLSRTPHQVIEGTLIAALSTAARQAVVYVNPRHDEALAAVQVAAEAWRSDALFARLRDQLGGTLDLQVVQSSGMYVGGEDTAVVASLEGRFPFPRRKPPYPTSAGVHGQPTVVNNVETLALVPHIVRNGAAWYQARGDAEAAGSKLFCLSGDVLRPGLYELPMGSTLRELVFDHGGGMLDGRPFKAAFTGGPSNTLLGGDDLDARLDFDALRARGARLGTGAIIVVSEGTSIVRRVADYIDFFAAASCGQCPPCKIGTQQVAHLLRRLERGRGTDAELAALESLAVLLPGSGRCGLVDGAAAVLSSSLVRFREEYEQQAAPAAPVRRVSTPRRGTAAGD